MDNLKIKLRNKKAKIGIIGLGYVGLPLCLRFLEVGFNVIGFDNDKSKIKKLKNGKSYIKTISSSKLNKLKKKFNITNNMSTISNVDVIIICLPTPLIKKTKKPDMTYIKRICNILKNKIRKNQAIILESTTYPGTTREYFLPIIQKNKLLVGKNFYLIYSPEREDPGNEKYSIKNIPKIVSGHTKACKEIGSLIYKSVAKRVVTVETLDHAEMVKLYENIFRSVNIGLANEMKLVCEKMGLNIYEIINAASSKPFGFLPFYPGPGYGGHCIPIDPFYLSWRSKQFGYDPKFIELSGKINSGMPKRIATKVTQLLKKNQKNKILILGVAYKKNVDDIRESPAIEIINYLSKNKKNKLSFYDPYINKILTRNKIFSKCEFFKLNFKKLKLFDVIIIVTDHDILDYEKIYKNSKLIVDCRGRYHKKKNDNIIKL
jgi:UDP-N-acetyl-D-glucosamine dehydrogenase